MTDSGEDRYFTFPFGWGPCAFHGRSWWVPGEHGVPTCGQCLISTDQRMAEPTPVVLRWRFVPTASRPNPKWFYTDNLDWKPSRPSSEVEVQTLFHGDSQEQAPPPQPCAPNMDLLVTTWGPDGPEVRPGRIHAWLRRVLHFDGQDGVS